MKNIIQFILILIPWFLSRFLFPIDSSYYQSLQLPFFAPPDFVFGVVWTILYILIAYSIYQIYQNECWKQLKNYNHTILSNYIFNQLFTFFFFTLRNTFLGFVDCVAVLITSLFFYYETKELNEKASKFLLPYLFWNLFACILCIFIYFMNL